MTDIELLIRDKYDGDATRVTYQDKERLAHGEPLAYIIGWIPFCGLKIYLDSRPLIPRVETEFWVSELIQELRMGGAPKAPRHILDIFSGSGAIGLSLLHHVPQAYVTLSELHTEHCAQINENIEKNNLIREHITVIRSDVFEDIPQQKFDLIVANPPYIPSGTTLPESVRDFEPYDALYAGVDGLDLIQKFFDSAPQYLAHKGELWVECNITNIEHAEHLAEKSGAVRTKLLPDQYGSPRVLVAYYI